MRHYVSTFEITLLKQSIVLCFHFQDYCIQQPIGGVNNMSARMSCLHIFSQAKLLCLNNQLGGKQHGITVLKESIGEVNNISARTSHLQLFSQDHVTDFSYHGTTVYYSAYYLLILVFPRKK